MYELATPKRHGHPWHQGEIDRLVREVNAGLSTKHIAARHDRSLVAIECAIAKHVEAKAPTGKGRLVINGVDYDAKFWYLRRLIGAKINLR